MALSLEEQDRRYAAIRKLMVRDGLDSLLVAGRGDYHGRANLRYVTDFGVISYEAYCILPLEGTPVVIGRHDLRLSKSKWVVEFSRGGRNNAEAVRQALARLDRGNKVGIVGMQEVSAIVYRAVAEQFGNRLVDATSLIEQLRSIKSPEEIERLRIAASTADKMVNTARSVVRPGLRDYDIYAEIKRISYQMGCEYSYDWVASGSMRKLFPPVGDRLEAKSTLAMYITPACDGYFSQVAAAMPVGKCQPNTRKMVSAWRQVLEASANRLRPGTEVSDIYRAMTEGAAAAGYELMPGFCGHEIGLSIAESWFFSDSDSTELKPGMTLALHPCLIGPDGADLMMGYTYIITDGGSEKLNKLDLAQDIL